MFRLLTNCIQHFGFAGVIIYFKIKLKLTKAIQLPGLRFPITMRNNKVDVITFREIFFKREYDIELPQSIQPTIIIDAGANIGFTSVFFANRFSQAKIFSFEPDAGNFEILRRNTNQYENIKVLQNAIWHRTEDIRIVDRGYGERGFVIEDGSDGILLKGISLPDMMKQHQITHIDILKMDIEGSEKEVFSENFEQWLPFTKCIIIELHDRMKPGCSGSVFSALSKYNYSMTIRGENLVFIKSELLN